MVWEMRFFFVISLFSFFFLLMIGIDFNWSINMKWIVVNNDCVLINGVMIGDIKFVIVIFLNWLICLLFVVELLMSVCEWCMIWLWLDCFVRSSVWLVWLISLLVFFRFDFVDVILKLSDSEMFWLEINKGDFEIIDWSWLVYLVVFVLLVLGSMV